MKAGPLERLNEEKNDASEMWYWRNLFKIQAETARIAKYSIVIKIKQNHSLELLIMNLKVNNFGHGV